MATETTKTLSPSKLAHVVLKTPNFTSMVAWYKDALGAYANFETPFIAFLTYDEEHHRIAIGNLPHSQIAGDSMMNAGLEHIAFTYKNLHELVTAYKQRKALGILPFWCVNHGTTTSMYYQDPDGNKIEMQVDGFADADDANAYFQSAAFAENPIGVDFDPEDLTQRIDNGEDEIELLKRPNIGPRGFESVPAAPKPINSYPFP